MNDQSEATSNDFGSPIVRRLPLGAVIRAVFRICRYTAFCMVLVLFTKNGARAEDAPPADDLLPKINALRTELVEAFEKRDVDRMLAQTHPDIIVTWQNGEVSHGHAELRKFFDRMMTGPNSVVENVKGNPVVEGRKIYKDEVISYGHMQDEFLLRGEKTPLKFDSRFSALLVRDGDRFLLAGLHLSTNTFDNPILGAAMKKFTIYGVGVLFLGVVLGLLLSKCCCKKSC